MALRSVAPRLTALAPRLARITDRHGHSKVSEPWRAWYGLARWKRLRWKVLLRDLFTCQRCHRIEADTSNLHADHIEPHHGDPVLFWSETNVQTLCTHCHNSAKQTAERAAR